MTAFTNTIYKGYDEHFKKIFQDDTTKTGVRNIKEFIIPHIFVQAVDALWNKWQNELTEDPPNKKHSRDSEIIGKEAVQYSILRLIHYTMSDLNNQEREKIEDEEAPF